MCTGIFKPAAFLFLSVALAVFCDAAPPLISPSRKRADNPLNIDWAPAPPPEDGPPASASALRNQDYIPAEIGGIVGSYAVALVLVATGLLALSKRRREHLRAGEDPLVVQFDDHSVFEGPFQSSHQLNKTATSETDSYQQFPYPLETPKTPQRTFLFPGSRSPTKTEESEASANVDPSPVSPSSTVIAPGVGLSVDQQVVAQDRRMAQQQLEDMYRLVMEHETAKEDEEGNGGGPPLPPARSRMDMQTGPPLPMSPRKERAKPAGLNLAQDDKKQSRATSILSALKSPRKKSQKAMNISSPIMTPMSESFPRQEGEELDTITPRQYAPAPPPPVPTINPLPFRRKAPAVAPDTSPDSVLSIDGRLDVALAQRQLNRENRGPPHAHHLSTAASSIAEQEPASAVSASSTAPLIGLPTSPKPGVNRFPSLTSLPASPKPGQTFQRPSAPSAVRTGGALPLRAYEPGLPSNRENGTKQTVFTRAAPLSPGLQAPFTGAPVPYTPYQPFSPVVPITPSLVTRADRKRMRKLEPKTPTLQMVRSDDDIW